MAKFTRTELESYRGATIPDLVGPDLRLLFVGINPGLLTAATNTPFAGLQNKFYPALVEAGILPELPDVSEGLSDEARADFLSRGLGITNVVARATGMARELKTAEYRLGGELLRTKVAAWKPPVVAILGVGAYQKAFDAHAVQGLQPALFEGAKLWVLPNPSPANPDKASRLAALYAEPARAAGVL